MLFAVILGLSVASVPLAGGRLLEIADVRLRRPWTIAFALLLQVLVLAVLPHGSPAAHQVLHLESYGFAGVFLWDNRRLPGLLVVASGGALNLAAIAANGGVMPASRSALAAAGIDPGSHGFANSAALAQPRLQPLGDVFAIPAPLPFHNVFSVGDVLVAAGVVVGLHVICRSRLASALPPPLAGR